MTKVRKKATKEPSTEAHRESITEDTEAFLKAVYKVSYIPDEVSELEPNTRGKLATPEQQQK